MKNLWKWGKKSDDPATNAHLDTWVRNNLEVEVPDGSFDRVQIQVYRRLQRTSPEPSLWELLQDLHRLRWWARCLGVASVGLAIAVVVVLKSPALPVKEKAGKLRVSRPQTGVSVEVTSKPVLHWLPSPEEQERAIRESYGLLKDNRVVYSNSLQENGGR